MAITTTNKNFKNKGKDIKYLDRDFIGFRNNLIEFAKNYFPKTYSDFNESSPGMMFIEMASYVGDSLSYYIDDTLKDDEESIRFNETPRVDFKDAMLNLKKFLAEMCFINKIIL